MGLDSNGIDLIFSAKDKGVDFLRTLTIGRQNLLLSEMALQKKLEDHNLSGYKAKDLLSEGNTFAEPFFKILGSKITDSVDFSSYEGASIIHDMNMPVPETMKNKYTAVLDGGSLEHIFNFPVAIRNCMDMISAGGHFIGITIVNNFVGHGFYQFSPELFYRTFDSGNGFVVKQMLLYIDQEDAAWYEVADPVKVGQRVTLSNSYPSYLFVLAQKLGRQNVFKVPQQSDYQNNCWLNNSKSPAISGDTHFYQKDKSINGDASGKENPSSILNFFRKCISAKIMVMKQSLRERRKKQKHAPDKNIIPIGNGNPAFFRKMKKQSVR